MAKITGDMAVMLDALGRRKSDSSWMRDILALAGPDMEVTEYDNETHYLFKPTGTELVIAEGFVERVVVLTRPDGKRKVDGKWVDARPAGWGMYPRPEALVEGLSGEATPAEVTALLGEPSLNGFRFQWFEANDRCLHVQYGSDNRVVKLLYDRGLGKRDTRKAVLTEIPI
ncbi:hypothetical protein IMZ48_13475 [Candidatus Bathyarchaeota archaeon]|nr:hypothetical protein [Candidatus Bathyarchaeota archaeon]